jgi:adenosylcobinamide-GDP ribazoletransferase
LKKMLWGVCLAFQFLTRIPIPCACPWERNTIRWALRSYFLVGLTIGGASALPYFLLDGIVPPLMQSLLILSVWVGITGGLHLDGWMDVADAVGANAPLEKRWQIMKDPHVGSFAVISLGFLLLWKLVFIYAIIDGYGEQANALSRLSPIQIAVSFMIIPASARVGALLLLYMLPSSKTEGLAWEWKKHLSLIDIVIAFLPILVLLWLYPANVMFAVLGFIPFTAVYGIWVRRTFQGVNGDLTGAFIEAGELWGLALLFVYSLLAAN